MEDNNPTSFEKKDISKIKKSFSLFYHTTAFHPIGEP
jgi:hypothetical protein